MPTDPKLKQDLLLATMKKLVGRKLEAVSITQNDKRSFRLHTKYEGESEVTLVINNTFDILIK